MKKLIAVVLAFLLSFALLEGFSNLQQKNNCEQLVLEKKIENKDLCFYKYKPFKNINFDFIAPNVSTDFNINNVTAEYAIIDDINEPESPMVKKIIPKTEKPKIAIVIDDMGISHSGTLNIISLDAPLTLSFLTYSKNLDDYINLANGKKFEIMAHIPMEAKTHFNEAPDLLKTSQTNKNVALKFNKMLDKFKDIKFINNHTGSLFTENKEKMNVIMQILKQRNIAFLDSKTSAKSVGREVAQKYNVKYLARNVFLDNENKFGYIMGQIKQTEKIAKKHGAAIAICHPKTQTFKALKHWIKTQKDFEVVNLSNI